MKTSDPYYEWLGIPPKDKPPNHYRLLGLELFEENRNVIDAAANRQMSFIKEYQAGPDSELSQKLLNELSAARLCLLSSPAKAAYDQQLRARLKAQATPTPALPIPPALRWRNEPDPPPPRAPRWKYFAKSVGKRDPAPRSHAACRASCAGQFQSDASRHGKTVRHSPPLQGRAWCAGRRGGAVGRHAGHRVGARPGIAAQVGANGVR